MLCAAKQSANAATCPPEIMHLHQRKRERLLGSQAVEMMQTRSTQVLPRQASRHQASAAWGLMGVVSTLANSSAAEFDMDEGEIDLEVKLEVERYESISFKTQAMGKKSPYYNGKDGERFNLRSFWADHKVFLPLHYHAYLAEVACKKSASANVESVFSGAGQFMDEAGTSGPVLLQRIVKLHYNWKYKFVRPTIDEVIELYNKKFKDH